MSCSEPILEPNVETGAVPNFTMSEGGLRERMARSTRSIALALDDPTVRHLVYQAMASSVHKEGKLHLRTYLEGPGRQLLTAMVQSEVLGLTESKALASLDSIVDLEFYMPVEEHRRQWTGGPDVLVASALYQDDVPVGYDIDGNAVVLRMDVPPSTPTLVTVPVETDFSIRPVIRADPPCGPEEDECGGGGGGGGGGGSQITGLVMFEWQIEDRTWDPWPFGSPEFEITVADHLDPSTGAPTSQTLWSCAGESWPTSSDNYWNYDDDGTNETGEIRVLTPTQWNDLDVPFFVIVSEDDGPPCASGNFPSAYVSTISPQDDKVGSFQFDSKPSALILQNFLHVEIITLAPIF